MKFLAVLAFLFASSAMALDITCEGPNLHYVYQFDMQTTLDLSLEEIQNLEEEGIRLEGQNLTAMVTNAGYDSTEEVLELKDLNLHVRRVDNTELYGKAFLHLVYTSKKEAAEKVFANIVVGYPGFMTSKIRLGGLRQYVSTCK
ncbi:MAG: hypothetical protein ACJAT2_002179 [Bacteriovoracaceae bacterium]|jgi:hypothetical protein